MFRVIRWHANVDLEQLCAVGCESEKALECAAPDSPVSPFQPRVDDATKAIVAIGSHDHEHRRTPDSGRIVRQHDGWARDSPRIKVGKTAVGCYPIVAVVRFQDIVDARMR